MHILVVKRKDPSWADSGRVAGFQRLVEGLATTHQVSVIEVLPGPGAARSPGALSVSQTGIRGLDRMNLWRAVRSVVRRRRPDLLLCAGWAAPRSPLPTVAVVRDLVGTGWTPLRPDPRRFRRYRRIVVPGIEAMRQVRAAGAGGWQVRVVPDPREVEPRRGARCPRAGHCLVHAGRILPAKGQHLSVDAVSRLPPRLRSQVHLHVVGPTGDRRYLGQLRVAARDQPILFHPDEAVGPRLAAADLVLYPTCLPEGLADVAIHAQAWSKAVIYADLPGVRESVGEVGIAVKPEDPVALREALVGALGDVGALSALGERGRAWVAERYAWSVVGPQWESVLQGALRG